MLEYLTLPMEGHEAEVFTILLTIRYSNHQRVFEATNTLRDVLAARVEAVFGLTTLHAALVSFRATPVPPPYSDEAKASSYAFGLIALAKFALRLPADDKKNLLTYLFDKHGVRGAEGSGSVDRLEREMRRLDGRTGTPVRPSTRSS